MELDEYGKHGAREDTLEVHDVRKQYNDMMDRIDMDRLGKKQELKRNFRLLSIFSFVRVPAGIMYGEDLLMLALDLIDRCVLL